MQNFVIKLCCWKTHRGELGAIRRCVFIEEQKVPEELEWDEFDQSAQHIIVLNNENSAVATGRIKKDGHIGRMAVLKNYRQQGIGSAILLALLEVAEKNNLSCVYLHAQTTAIGFYQKHGFSCQGVEFLDAGIAHKIMVKKLK